jgi:hypothetical protein
MKKVLFGTTALVTAGVAAALPAAAEEGITLGLGGYMNNYFVAGSISEDTNVGTPQRYNSTGMFSDGEVHFTGETTLDNGVTFGAQIQLESYATGDQIDENYGYMSGSFGRMVFGSENSAAYLMHYGSPSIGIPVNSGWVTAFIPAHASSTTGFRRPALSTYLDYGNDENQLTYFTPRFYGFQIGVSYAPTVIGSGDGKNFPVEANKNTEYHDGMAIGVNFVENFGDAEVAVSAGYRRASKPDFSTTLQDLEMWSVGVNISFSGFTVGASYAEESEGNRATEGEAFDIGFTYYNGPWGVGAQYISTEVQGTTTITGEDQMSAISAGVSYNVGPGITAAAAIMWGEWTDESTGTNDQEGLVGVVGISFSF